MNAPWSAWRDNWGKARSPFDARNALNAPEDVNSGDTTYYVRRNRVWTSLATYLSGNLIPLLGVTDGSAAAAGTVGELKTAQQAVAQALTNNTALSLVQLTSLPAGDWDIWGIVGYTGGATTTMQYAFADISNTVNTLANSLGRSTSMIPAGAAVFGAAANLWIPTPVVPVNIASATTYFLNAQAGFAVSTCSATALIYARRRH